MKRILLLLALVPAILVLGQDGPNANQTIGPPMKAWQRVLFYSASSLQYVCWAPSNQLTTRTVTVTAASNANPVSFTATSHGFDYQSGATTTPVVKITGATSGWTGINGVWIATPTSANAFTIPVDSSAFGALSGTLVVTTIAPRLSDPIWSIQKFVYDASGNVIWSGWASNPAGAAGTNLVAGSTGNNLACSSRTSYSYQ